MKKTPSEARTTDDPPTLAAEDLAQTDGGFLSTVALIGYEEVSKENDKEDEKKSSNPARPDPMSFVK
jgi:hypothetical protein